MEESPETKTLPSELQQEPTSELPSTPKKRLHYRTIAIVLFLFLAGIGVLLLLNLKQKTIKAPQSETSDQTVSHAQPGNGEKVVAAVAAALESRDWETLFGLTSSTFTADTTVEDFVASLSAQEADIGQVVDVEILSKPDYQSSPQGIQFFTVQTRYTFDVDGTPEVEETVDHYVLEDGEWKFWFSATE